MASNAIKRQRKRRRIDTDGDPEFQVAPMVDVLLVLMLFFMAITSTEVLKKDRNLVLPDAKNAKKPAHHEHEIVVNVGWDAINSAAQFSMNGAQYPSAGDLQAPIQAAMAHDRQGIVVLRADKDVQYSNISAVMNTCANAGVATVTFSALIGGAKPGAAPASGAAPK